MFYWSLWFLESISNMQLRNMRKVLYRQNILLCSYSRHANIHILRQIALMRKFNWIRKAFNNIKRILYFSLLFKDKEKRIGRMTLQPCSIQGICNWEENVYKTFTRIIDKKTVIFFFCIILKTIIVCCLDILWEINNSLKLLQVIWLHTEIFFLEYIEKNIKKWNIPIVRRNVFHFRHQISSNSIFKNA